MVCKKNNMAHFVQYQMSFMFYNIANLTYFNPQVILFIYKRREKYCKQTCFKLLNVRKKRVCAKKMYLGSNSNNSL